MSDYVVKKDKITLLFKIHKVDKLGVFFYFNQQCKICICYFNNIYIVITPTCVDTFVSSSGSSKVVLR